MKTRPPVRAKRIGGPDGRRCLGLFNLCRLGIFGSFNQPRVTASCRVNAARAEGADEDGSGVEAEGATEGTDEDDTYKYVRNWEEESKTVKDSPFGGAFVEVKLSTPEVVRCMQIIVPPRLKAQFPQAARIQFSENGLDWKTAQALEPIGQESLLVKTLTGHAEQQYLETRGEKFPPPPAPVTEENSVPKKTLAEAVAAAMNAARASVDKGALIIIIITIIIIIITITTTIIIIVIRERGIPASPLPNSTRKSAATISSSLREARCDEAAVACLGASRGPFQQRDHRDRFRGCHDGNRCCALLLRDALLLPEPEQQAGARLLRQPQQRRVEWSLSLGDDAVRDCRQAELGG